MNSIIYDTLIMCGVFAIIIFSLMAIIGIVVLGVLLFTKLLMKLKIEM